MLSNDGKEVDMFTRYQNRNRIRSLAEATEPLRIEVVFPLRSLPSATEACRSSMLAWVASVVVTR